MVRASYDTLTLKLQDSLDQFERYSEKPQETAFFTQLVGYFCVVIILQEKCYVFFVALG